MVVQLFNHFHETQASNLLSCDRSRRQSEAIVVKWDVRNMRETIFADRRKDLKRRNDLMPYSQRDCRRAACDRRRDSANEAVTNWWLKVDYSNNPG